jgi:hypothetical protein
VTQIKEHRPVDVTTNPSLVLAAIDVPSYEPIIRKALQDEAHAGVVDKVNPYAGELFSLLVHPPAPCPAPLSSETSANQVLCMV